MSRYLRSFFSSLCFVLGGTGSSLRPAHAFRSLPGQPTSPVGRRAVQSVSLRRWGLDQDTASPWRLYAENPSDGEDALDQVKQEQQRFTTPFDRPLLAVVDAAALVGFAAVGKASHNANDGTIQLTAVLQTAFPFLVAWFGTSPLTGVYNNNRNASETNLVMATVQQIVVGWVVAVPLGCALRGILKGYNPPISFVIVTLIATLVILSVTRIGFAIVEDFFVELVN